MPIVRLIEASGEGQDEMVVQSTALLAGDEHTTDSYAQDPLVPGPNPGSFAYSYERWLRVEFSGSYGTITGFRFWCPGLVVPDNWRVRYGTSNAYVAPVDTESAIATDPVPTSDPGEGAPNVGGSITGPGTNYSDWIVLQARSQGGSPPGPILGFDHLGAAVPLAFEFHWTETD